MSFASLALILLAGILGPLLALPRRWHLPIVFGELVAGVLLGPTMGLNLLDAGDRTFAMVANVGFVLTMFVAGSHVPMRDPRLRDCLRVGASRAAAVGVLAAVLGPLVARLFGDGHGGLYAVLMASSSAAFVLPAVHELELSGRPVLELLAQVAVADTACIVALPLVIDPGHAGRAALGALAVIAAAGLLFVVLRQLERSGARKRVHRISEERNFALELRINLVLLFALAAVATRLTVSIMLAGFSFGLVVAAVGEPRRLARQLFAVTEGFLGPVFFVWLGASLDLRDVVRHPAVVPLALALAGGAVAVHAAMRLARQPVAIGVLAAAQVGVPVAAATIGSQLGVLRPGEAPALILAAIITIGASVLAGSVVAAR